MKGVAQKASGAQFTIEATTQQNSGVNPTPVKQTGGKVETVRKFIEANPAVLEEMGRVGAVTEAFNQIGDEWGEAWKTVEKEVDHDLEVSGDFSMNPEGVTCPRCGNEFDILPQHLPTCQG